MRFDDEKEKTLKKMVEDDRSDKGFVDKRVKALLNRINSLDDYYSTSSCSGRIILLTIPSSGSKKESKFLYRTHEQAFEDDLLETIHSLKDVKDSVWFRQEPAILHVVTRTLKDSSDILRAARTIGFKRSGLFEVENRFVMELMSTEKIDTIVAKNGKVLVSDDYLKTLVLEANKKLQRTWDKIERLEEELKKF